VIPKLLNEIEWSDIEALRDSGREEDDTIEYKSSFSGGSDFLAFTDSQRVKAVEGVVREALAFLNGRGGDVVIGVREAKNDHPKIEEITPVANVVATVDRLAQSLAAVIEPTQSILGVKAIPRPDGNGDGVIVVRSPSSLRAPHRYMGNKECYIRRGRESVPMPMDEVQDVTIRRTDLRREQLQALSSFFNDLGGDRSGRSLLSAHRFQIRAVYLPLQQLECPIDDAVTAALRGSDPNLSRAGKTEQIDVPFRYLGHNWRPVLRGRRIENLQNSAWGENDFLFCAKELRSSGAMIAEFACRIELNGQGDRQHGFHLPWLAGFFANCLQSFSNVLAQRPAFCPGVLRFAIYAAGPITTSVSDGNWGPTRFEWPSGAISLPDFTVESRQCLFSVFDQAQVDVASIVGFELPKRYEFGPQ
jgi:Putative DNA-binding domain